jgi:hypothetical protein
VGPSKRLNELADKRKGKSTLYVGGQNLPDIIRTAPPSIWSPPKVSPHSKQKVHRVMLRDFRQSESVMLRLLSKYDTDNDGFIDERELRALLSDMSYEGIASTTLDEKLVRTLLNAIDSDGSGKVSTDELMRAWKGWLGRALLPTRCLLIIDVQNDFIGGVIELALAFEDVEEIAHAAAVAFVGESDGAIVGVNGIDQRTVAHLFV